MKAVSHLWVFILSRQRGTRALGQGFLTKSNRSVSFSCGRVYLVIYWLCESPTAQTFGEAVILLRNRWRSFSISSSSDRLCHHWNSYSYKPVTFCPFFLPSLSLLVRSLQYLSSGLRYQDSGTGSTRLWSLDFPEHDVLRYPGRSWFKNTCWGS